MGCAAEKETNRNLMPSKGCKVKQKLLGFDTKGASESEIDSMYSEMMINDGGTSSGNS